MTSARTAPVSVTRDGRRPAGRAGPDDARHVLRHYENFPVLSRFVPPELRGAFAAVYAFARVTDDLGDEIGAAPEVRLNALSRWSAEFERALASGVAAEEGGGVVHGVEETDPVLAGATAAIRIHDLPPEAFRALIEANRRDQVRTHYATYGDLLASCALSANPVGRIVLDLLGGGGPEETAASDAICTALQLANHWQGIGEDLRHRGRLYVPREDLERFGVAEDDLRRDRPDRSTRRLIGHLLDRTRELLERGAGLPERFEPRRASVLRLFVRGGRAILDALEARPDEVLRRTLRVPRRRAILLVLVEELRLRIRAA